MALRAVALGCLAALWLAGGVTDAGESPGIETVRTPQLAQGGKRREVEQKLEEERRAKAEVARKRRETEKRKKEEAARKRREAESKRRKAEDARKRRAAEKRRKVEEARKKAEAEKRKRAAAGRVFKDCPECPEMVVIPAGSFMMGSPAGEVGRGDDEGPQHRVRIAKPFALGKYEVTFAEWDACVAAGGCNGYRPYDVGWGRGRRPVINVSWADAKAYVAWLSRRTGKRYRLPSEAEWEYSARAGATAPRHWGQSADAGCGYANGEDLTLKEYGGKSTAANCRDGYFATAPVGSFRPNRFGLHDVLGNAAEWVEDCWNGSYNGAPSDGTAWASGDCSQRGLRGGSWGSSPVFVRSAFRGRYVTGYRHNYEGFRVARTLP